MSPHQCLLTSPSSSSDIPPKGGSEEDDNEDGLTKVVEEDKKSTSATYWGKVILSILVSTLFWGATLPLLILILVPSRFLIQTCLNLLYGKGRYTLAKGVDAVFAHDRTPGTSSAPHMLLVFEGEAPKLSLIQNRFLHQAFNYQEGGHRIYAERLKKRFISSKYGWPVWEDMEASFDIENHVTQLDFPMTEEDLLDILGKFLQEKEVKQDAPQWEFILIPNYIPSASPDSSPKKNYYACVARVHHAYGDGASFLLLVDTALGDKPISWTINPLESQNSPRSSTFQHWLHYAKSYVMGPLPFLQTILTSAIDSSPFIIRGGYSGSKVVSYTSQMDLRFFKELARASGTSFSSIVLSAMSSSLRKLQISRKMMKYQDFEDSLNVGVVAAILPYTSRRFQNSFSIFYTKCAFRDANPLTRLEKTHALLRQVSQGTDPLFNFFMMRFTGLLPRLVQELLMSKAGTPALWSNIPGPSKPISMFGGQVVDLAGWLPIVNTYGLGMTSISNCGQVRFCLTVDSALIPTRLDLENLVREMEVELTALGKDFQVKTPLLPKQDSHLTPPSLYKIKHNNRLISTPYFAEERTVA